MVFKSALHVSCDQGCQKVMWIFCLVVIFGLPTNTVGNSRSVPLMALGLMCRITMSGIW